LNNTYRYSKFDKCCYGKSGAVCFDLPPIDGAADGGARSPE